MHPPYVLTSARLGFRPWRDADRAPFAAMNADPEVRRYFPDVQTRAESDASVDRLVAAFARDGHTFWAVDTLDDGAFAGMLGVLLQREMPTVLPEPTYEIGWRLRRGLWGRGLATEGAAANLAWAFATTDAERVVAFTTVANAPSRRVMEKAGMRYAGDFDHPALAGQALAPHVLYERLRGGGG